MFHESQQTRALIGLLMTCLLLAPLMAHSAGLPGKGATLPPFQLPAPQIEEDKEYLGLKGEAFKLKDLECQLVLIEILGVYCPLCLQQLPTFNSLFERLNKKNLGEKVKMLGVAVGATPVEVEFLRKGASYEYPVVHDESFTVHKLLGEPRTPFTMLVSKDGTVIYSHQGIIEDVDTIYQMIQEQAK